MQNRALCWKISTSHWLYKTVSICWKIIYFLNVLLRDMIFKIVLLSVCWLKNVWWMFCCEIKYFFNVLLRDMVFKIVSLSVCWSKNVWWMFCWEIKYFLNVLLRDMVFKNHISRQNFQKVFNFPAHHSANIFQSANTQQNNFKNHISV